MADVVLADIGELEGGGCDQSVCPTPNINRGINAYCQRNNHTNGPDNRIPNHISRRVHSARTKADDAASGM